MSDHRLFLACPVPVDAAETLCEWASTALVEGDGLRLVRAQDLHATLAFFPKVPDAELEEFVGLTRAIVWAPIAVATGGLSKLGRGALAVGLAASSEAMRELDSKLFKCSLFLEDLGDECQRWDWHRSLAKEPLGVLSLKQGPADWEPRIRRHRHDGPLALHVTLARAKRMPNNLPTPPRLEFSLDRVSLYESVLEPEGAKYRVLATSDE